MTEATKPMSPFIGKIEAELVDPNVELPPDGWKGLVIWKFNGEERMGFWSGMEWRSPGENPFLYYLSEIAAWLRIGGPLTVVLREAVKRREAEIWNDLVESCEEIVGYDGDLASKMAGEAILDKMRHIQPKKEKNHDS